MLLQFDQKVYPITNQESQLKLTKCQLLHDSHGYSDNFPPLKDRTTCANQEEAGSVFSYKVKKKVPSIRSNFTSSNRKRKYVRKSNYL